MDFFTVLGLVCAVGCAILLFKEGYDGEYFELFILSIVLQALFVGGALLMLRNYIPYSTKMLIVLAVVSFVWAILGYFAFSGSMRRSERKRKNEIARNEEARRKAESKRQEELRQGELHRKQFVEKYKDLIRGGRKNREFQTFVKEHGDRIGMISCLGTVFYAPKGVELFEEVIKGDYVNTIWSSLIGAPQENHPAGTTQYQWQRKEFFRIEQGERQWTAEEQLAIALVIGETLPGGKSQWEGPGFSEDNQLIFVNADQVIPSILNLVRTRSYIRKLKAPVHRQNLKDPY